VVTSKKLNQENQKLNQENKSNYKAIRLNFIFT